MSWYEHARRTKRTPLMVVEMDHDYIDDESVTATNADGSLCYRTPATTDQGDLTVTTKTRRYMSHKQRRPLPELGAIPCLKNVTFSDEEIRVGKALGFFGQVTFELEDFEDDDRREDPFYTDSSRDGVDHSAGSYWSKFLARNPYWTERVVRVVEGWATDGVWWPSDVISHKYFIRDVQGVSDNKVRVTAVGPLQMLNLNEKEVPAPSAGSLLADIDDTTTSATIDTGDNAATYAASGFARIGDEYCAFTRSGTALTLTRAQGDTEAASHSAGDTIQECIVYDNERIIDIILDLLTTHGGIAAQYINELEFENEFSSYLTLYNLSGVISKPEAVLDVVRELLEAAACMMWWDDTRGEIRFKALRPSTASKGLWTDRLHLLKKPVFNRDMGQRISRTDIFMNLRTVTSDPKTLTSFRVRLLGNAQGEGDTEHGSAKLPNQPMRTRWLTSAQLSLASRASNQVTSQLRDGRKTAICEVAAKDANRQIGDIVDLKTRELVDRNGAELQTRYIVEKRTIIKAGSSYRYLLEELPFGGRYAFLCPTGMPAYDDASDAERDPGWYLSPADNEPFDSLNPAYQLG